MKFESFKEALAAAHAAHRNSDLETAAEIYRSLPSAYPQKKHAALRAAEGLHRCGLWSDAVAVLQKALERWPSSPMYLTHLSKMYADVGESAKAAEYLRRSLDQGFGRSAETWKYLGDLFAHAGDFESAVAAYDKFLESEPLNVDAILRRGDALIALQRFEDAGVDFRRADAIQPGRPETLLKIGESALEYGSPWEAAEYLRRAIVADPGNVVGYANLSLALSVLGQFESAVSMAEQGNEVEHTPLGNFALGTALIGLERYDEAADVLRSAAEVAHGNVRILMALAEAETARDDVFAAERALQQVLVAEPDNRQARFLIAALHGEAIDSPPADMAATIFDLMSARYDHQFVPSRQYAAPVAACELIEKTLPDQSEFKGVLDLGCGTGLVAAALRDAFRIDRAVGIDIAARMIAIAAEKDLYDHLITGDAVAGMGALAESFDLITAIELAPYLGNLVPLLTAAYSCLTPGGLFLCSIELSDGVAMQLRRGGRFAHSSVQVEAAARAAGLELLASSELPLHQSRAARSQGALLLFRHP